MCRWIVFNSVDELTVFKIRVGELSCRWTVSIPDLTATNKWLIAFGL